MTHLTLAAESSFKQRMLTMNFSVPVRTSNAHIWKTNSKTIPHLQPVSLAPLNYSAPIMPTRTVTQINQVKRVLVHPRKRFLSPTDAWKYQQSGKWDILKGKCFSPEILLMPCHTAVRALSGTEYQKQKYASHTCSFESERHRVTDRHSWLVHQERLLHQN